MPLNHRLLAAAFAGALALCASAAQASVTYQFNIDTSSLAGTSGYIEFQAGNSGFGPIQLLTATISNFQSPGGAPQNVDPHTSVDLFNIPDVLGTITGTLPAAVTLHDDGSVSVTDYLHPFDFGTSISFLVTLGGPAADASSCSGCAAHDFAVGLLDANEQYVLADNAADPVHGFLLGGFDIAGDGSFAAFLSPDANGATALAVSAAPVPEAATWSLMLLGVGAAGLTFRRRAAR